MCKERSSLWIEHLRLNHSTETWKSVPSCTTVCCFWSLLFYCTSSFVCIQKGILNSESMWQFLISVVLLLCLCYKRCINIRTRCGLYIFLQVTNQWNNLQCWSESSYLLSHVELAQPFRCTRVLPPWSLNTRKRHRSQGETIARDGLPGRPKRKLSNSFWRESFCFE